MNSVIYAHLSSDLGPLFLRAQNDRLTGLFFADQAHCPAISSDWMENEQADIFLQTIGEVNEFAAGERQEFSVETSAAGTPFQMRVWRVLAAIPYGETVTYADVARRIGSPAAVRATGAAIGRNPLSVIVPCHRVIGSSRDLTGYAGGLPRKQRLLDLERSSIFASCSSAGF